MSRATTVGLAPSAMTSPGGSWPQYSGTDAYSSTVEPRSYSVYRTTAPSSTPSASTTPPLVYDSSFPSRLSAPVAVAQLVAYRDPAVLRAATWAPSGRGAGGLLDVALDERASSVCTRRADRRAGRRPRRSGERRARPQRQLDAGSPSARRPRVRGFDARTSSSSYLTPRRAAAPRHRARARVRRPCRAPGATSRMSRMPSRSPASWRTAGRRCRRAERPRRGPLEPEFSSSRRRATPAREPPVDRVPELAHEREIVGGCGAITGRGARATDSGLRDSRTGGSGRALVTSSPLETPPPCAARGRPRPGVRTGEVTGEEPVGRPLADAAERDEPRLHILVGERPELVSRSRSARAPTCTRPSGGRSRSEELLLACGATRSRVGNAQA